MSWGLVVTDWSQRTPGRWISDREILASIYIELENGSEVEISAAVTLKGMHSTIDDVCARVYPHGPDIAIDWIDVDDETELRLIMAADTLAKELRDPLLP